VLTAVAPTGATIVITGSSTVIHPGDTTPSTPDDTDFGSATMGGGNIVKTYTVSNFGTVGTLNLSAPTFLEPGAFAVTTPLSSYALAPSETATFTVTYTPHSGARSVDNATVSLASDAADNDPYEFDITATTLNDGTITTPGDGYTGDYRIAFVSNGKTSAVSQVIGDYNTFVSDEAIAVTELNALGTTWTCIGSTSTVDARDNTDTNPSSTGVPIYTTSGQRIADDNADLWNDSIQNPIFFGDGTVAGVVGGTQEQTWTGTDNDGTARPVGGDGSYLGSGFGGDNTASYITLVRGGYTDKNWINGPSDHDGYEGGNRPEGPATEKHFMAMSGLLSTEPIPPAGTVLMVK